MKRCIKFVAQIEEAINIGNNFDFNEGLNTKMLPICGLGDSNWREHFKDILKDELKTPNELVKDYDIPNYVSTETLVICSSFQEILKRQYQR